MGNFLNDALVITSIGAVLGFATAVITQNWNRRKSIGHEQSLKSKITILSASLKRSAYLIGEIEKEISKKQELVDNLTKDADTYDALLKLRKNEVEAIASALQSGAKEQNKRSFWISVIINFLFFLAGSAVSFWITKYA